MKCRKYTRIIRAVSVFFLITLVISSCSHNISNQSGIPNASICGGVSLSEMTSILHHEAEYGDLGGSCTFVGARAEFIDFGYGRSKNAIAGVNSVIKLAKSDIQNSISYNNNVIIMNVPVQIIQLTQRFGGTLFAVCKVGNIYVKVELTPNVPNSVDAAKRVITTIISYLINKS